METLQKKLGTIKTITIARIASSSINDNFAEVKSNKTLSYSVCWVSCIPEPEAKMNFFWHSGVGEVLAARVLILLADFILFGVISLQNCRTLLEYKVSAIFIIMYIWKTACGSYVL